MEIIFYLERDKRQTIPKIKQIDRQTDRQRYRSYRHGYKVDADIEKYTHTYIYVDKELKAGIKMVERLRCALLFYIDGQKVFSNQMNSINNLK